MARKTRVEFEGALYHVIVRGNQRQKIFRDEQDRLSYLVRLEHYRKRYGFTLYAYVLMSNHVHLLLETASVSLSKIMQGIQFSYTQLYNRRHRTVGHLFQGRYKAILCDRDRYLLELVRYIHLNPARMRSPIDPWKYRWSSHRGYVGEVTPAVVETEPVLGQLGRTVGQARRAYLQFLREGLESGHEEKYYQTTDQRFLGDEAFVAKVVSKARNHKDVQPSGPRVGFEQLLAVVCNRHGVAAEELVGSGRRNDWVQARRQLVYLGREWVKMTTLELGKRLKRDPSMISRLYKEYEENRDLRRESIVARTLNSRAPS